ncbi:persephin [Vicugna pacos]|uniref:Persephin n=1 Tax=Vicugna pacos TaxID=30538 RepID=A0ABM5C6N4_VICPA
MATGRVLLGSLLLLIPQLDPGGNPGTWGALVEDGGLLSHPVGDRGTQRPQLGTRLHRAPASPCQLWSLSLPVAELGLGYTSEETVIFRYCAGSCPHGARTQHGLTLAWLRSQGRAHGGPCCRPTRYADVAFLDDHHRWQRLPQLSAAACGCGG